MDGNKAERIVNCKEKEMIKRILIVLLGVAAIVFIPYKVWSLFENDYTFFDWHREYYLTAWFSGAVAIAFALFVLLLIVGLLSGIVYYIIDGDLKRVSQE